ncbi:MAG: hypothetical protein ACR2QG_08735 [Gammaproteobacteria bacterium]
MALLKQSTDFNRLWITAALLIFFSSDISAGSWDYGHRISLGANYSDNPTLADDDRDVDSLFKMLASYNLDIEWSEANRTFAMQPRITRDYYPDSDNSDLESTDYIIPGQFTILRDRGSLGLIFNFREQNILSTEAAIIDSPDTTNFRADDTRNTYNLGFNYSYILTPRDQINIGASWLKTDFDLDYTGRADSDGYLANGSYSHSLTNRQSIGFSFNYFQSDSDALDCLNDVLGYEDINGQPSASFDPCRDDQVNIKRETESDTFSATFNYRAVLTPTLEFSARYGRRKTNNESRVRDANGNLLTVVVIDPINGPIRVPAFTDFKTDSTGDTYDISLSGNYQRYRFDLGGTRTITPSSNGTPNNTTAIRLTQTYNLTQKASAKLILRGTEREDAVREASNAPDRKTRTFEGDLRLSYRLSRKWNLGFGYKYRYRERDEAALFGVQKQKASSNRFNLSINYILKQIPN